MFCIVVTCVLTPCADAPRESRRKQHRGARVCSRGEPVPGAPEGSAHPGCHVRTELLSLKRAIERGRECWRTNERASKGRRTRTAGWFSWAIEELATWRGGCHCDRSSTAGLPYAGEPSPVSAARSSLTAPQPSQAAFACSAGPLEQPQNDSSAHDTGKRISTRALNITPPFCRSS